MFSLLRFTCFFLAASITAVGLCSDDPQPKEPQPLKKTQLGSTPNVHASGPVLLAGQPSAEDLELAKKKGVKVVISLREPGEITWDEKAAAERLGLRFLSLPFNNPAKLTDEVFDDARKVLRGAESSPVLLHCGAGIRVAPIWIAYRVLDQNVPIGQARKEAAALGLRPGTLEERANEYIAKERQNAGR